MHKRKKLIFIFSGLLFMIVIIYFTYLFFSSSHKDVYIEYGDQLPIDIENMVYNNADAQESLIFYFSNTCTGCLDKLGFVSRISNIYSDLQVIILWDKDIPNARLTKLGDNNIKNYSLEGKYKINGGSVPQCFMTDNSGEINYTTSDLTLYSFVNRLLGMRDYEGILDNALLSILGNKDSDAFIIFDSEDCSGCVDLSKEINEIKLEDRYNVVFVKAFGDMSRDNEIIDTGRYYQKLFGVDLFPAIFYYSASSNTLNNVDNLENY